MKRYILLLFTCLFVLIANAQDVTLRGTVTSKTDQQPVIGAYVKVKGSTQGAVTDIDGHYTIKVPAKATIEVTSIGYTTQTIAVNGRSNIDVVLADAASDLNEVVVIGYGAVKKGDLTSSISAIKGDELEHLTTGNVMNALQGQVNGVQISNSGSPGATPRVI